MFVIKKLYYFVLTKGCDEGIISSNGLIDASLIFVFGKA